MALTAEIIRLLDEKKLDSIIKPTNQKATSRRGRDVTYTLKTADSTDQQ